MAKEKEFTREALLKSRLFEGYQKDFLAVILKEPAYTIADAKREVEKVFGKKERD